MLLSVSDVESERGPPTGSNTRVRRIERIPADEDEEEDGGGGEAQIKDGDAGSFSSADRMGEGKKKGDEDAHGFGCVLFTPVRIRFPGRPQAWIPLRDLHVVERPG